MYLQLEQRAYTPPTQIELTDFLPKKFQPSFFFAAIEKSSLAILGFFLFLQQVRQRLKLLYFNYNLTLIFRLSSLAILNFTQTIIQYFDQKIFLYINLNNFIYIYSIYNL